MTGWSKKPVQDAMDAAGIPEAERGEFARPVPLDLVQKAVVLGGDLMQLVLETFGPDLNISSEVRFKLALASLHAGIAQTEAIVRLLTPEKSRTEGDKELEAIFQNQRLWATTVAKGIK